jgi:hypothetical protein
VNILDENVPLEQRDLLRAWGIHCCYWITTSVPRVWSGANRRQRAYSGRRRQPVIPRTDLAKPECLLRKLTIPPLSPAGRADGPPVMSRNVERINRGNLAFARFV